jgi:hypothetical protein
VDAGTNKVGINTGTPNGLLEVRSGVVTETALLVGRESSTDQSGDICQLWSTKATGFDFIDIKSGATYGSGAWSGGTKVFGVSAEGLTETQNIYPLANDTYYLGKNDDDTPLAWKGVIVKDTTNGKYYRVEVINGTVTATDLTD